MRLLAVLAALWLALPASAGEIQTQAGLTQETLLVSPGRIGRVGQAGQGNLGYIPILDGLGVTPVAAWEFFRLVSTYTGPHFELREDNGDTLDDFSDDTNTGVPVNGDGQTVAEWLTANSASNAYVRTLYDQIGSNDLQQTTNANQPLYSATGFNGLPCGDFNGSSHYLEADAVSDHFDGNDTPVTVLAGVEGTSAGGAVWGAGSSSSNTPLDRATVSDSSHGRFRRGVSIVKSIAADADSGESIASSRVDSSPELYWYANTAILGEGVDFNSDTLSVDTFAVGAHRRTSVDTHFDGNITGVIVFNSDIGAAAEATLRASYIAAKGL